MLHHSGPLRGIALPLALSGLLAAACADDPEPEAPDGGVEDVADDEDDREPLALDASCTNEELGFTIDYPGDWHVNEDGTLPACSVFDPEPVDLPEDRNLPTDLAVTVRQERVAFDEPDHEDDPTVEVRASESVTVDGRDAEIVMLRATGDGLHAEGLVTHRYRVDRDGQTLVAETHESDGGEDHGAGRGLLDVMMDSLEFTASPAGTPEDEQAVVEPLAGEPSTQDTEADSGAGTLAVTDVDVAAHEGFDRVTLSIAGDGRAGWFAGYDASTSQGSGEPVEVEGETVLRVAVTMATLPPDLPEDIEPWDGERLEAPGDGVVTEVLDDTIFEGHHVLFIGTTGEQPFLVERLDDPQRVVIDVHHD